MSKMVGDLWQMDEMANDDLGGMKRKEMS